MKIVKLILLSVGLVVPSLWPAHALDTDAMLGGALGGALGSVVGSELGGRTGAIVGGAIGSAAVTAITTNNRIFSPREAYYDDSYGYYEDSPAYTVYQPKSKRKYKHNYRYRN